ncbi:replicative DNA helicase [Candidatus Dojkabacteria bacterium]|nr:replicative DNA helicase [Candidatus Dojkabacteria bacterium]
MERVPPQNLEAEQSVIGSMLLEKDAIINVAEFLLPEHFYEERHNIVYSTILKLFQDGISVDIVTLSDELKRSKNLKKIGGRTYLTDLAAMVPTAAHAEEYATIVKENATRRNLISAASKITQFSFNEEKPVQEVVDESEQLLFGVAQSGLRAKFVHIKDLLKDAYERAEQIDKSNSYMGISTGLKGLDALLGGFQKSDLVIVAARPSVGKTSLALDFLRFAGVIEKKKVAFFSLEMSNTQIIDRLLGMQATVPFWDIRTGKLSDDDFAKLGDSMGMLAEADIFIDDKPGQSINEIRTKARRLALEQGVDIIFVDYLQLLHGYTKDNRVQEVSEISQGLKNIARELEVPVVALSQLSRAIESRATRNPQLSDLRESGSIEQDADVVMFIDREETYNPDTDRKGIADIVVAKHRNGPTGKIEVAFVKEIASFRNLAKPSE